MESNNCIRGEAKSIHGKHEQIDNSCAAVQEKAQVSVTGSSEFESKFSESEHKEEEDVPVVGSLKLKHNKPVCETKAEGPSEESQKLVGSSCEPTSLDLAQDKDKEWGLDKSLPPIKTRRDGHSSECSPSDISPPSPKRLRQGSKEREDQWNGLWTAEEIK